MRQRRRRDANRIRHHRDIETNRVIEFASRWAPYGGATEEEILVEFGMTPRRFIERLWQVIPDSNCTQDQVSRLASAYPPDDEVPPPLLKPRPSVRGLPN
jgi:hypothetical protein